MTSFTELVKPISHILKKDDVSENSSSVSYSCTADSLELSEITQLLSSVYDTGFVSDLSFSVQYKSDRAPTKIIYASGENIEVGRSESEELGPTTTPDWISNFKRNAAFYISENDLTSLSEEISERQQTHSQSIGVNIRLDKTAISEEIRSIIRNESGADNFNISFWTSPRKLQEWQLNTNLRTLFEKLFETSCPPVFVFVDGLETSIFETMPLLRLDELESISTEEWSKYINALHTCIKDEKEIPRPAFVSNGFSPELFSTPTHRSLFNKLFFAGTLSIISESARIDDDNLLLEISSSKKKIDSEIPLSELNISDEDCLRELYDFYQEYAQRADREIYRKLWYQAITEHCPTVEDLPKHQSDIVYFYRSLEAETVRGNFDELSAAVQDAQIFIGDVTNTLSDTTVNLTSEIQRVVIALFVIVATNIFLVVRQGSVDTAIPFTSAVSAGLLLLYIPVSQERVSEVYSIIEEGREDADVYSQLVETVGGDQFFDMDTFEDRQDQYIELAEDRADWADKQLGIAFEVISVIWALTAASSIIFYSPLSAQAIVSICTLPAAIWIWINHKNYQYYSGELLESLFKPESPIVLVIISVPASIVFTLARTFG